MLLFFRQPRSNRHTDDVFLLTRITMQQEDEGGQQIVIQRHALRTRRRQHSLACVGRQCEGNKRALVTCHLLTRLIGGDIKNRQRPRQGILPVTHRVLIGVTLTPLFLVLHVVGILQQRFWRQRFTVICGLQFA